MEETKVKYKADYLFSKCNFMKGIGSVLNLPGNYYEFNTFKTEQEADNRALTSDWQNVGNDIEKARKKFEKQNYNKLCLK